MATAIVQGIRGYLELRLLGKRLGPDPRPSVEDEQDQTTGYIQSENCSRLIHRGRSEWWLNRWMDR